MFRDILKSVQQSRNFLQYYKMICFMTKILWNDQELLSTSIHLCQYYDNDIDSYFMIFIVSNQNQSTVSISELKAFSNDLHTKVSQRPISTKSKL